MVSRLNYYVYRLKASMQWSYIFSQLVMASMSTLPYGAPLLVSYLIHAYWYQLVIVRWLQNVRRFELPI